MKKNILVLLLLFDIYTIQAQQNTGTEKPPATITAQQPPIPIEILPGSDRFYFQTIIIRDIPGTKGKLKFVSVTNYATEYKNENAVNNDFTSVNILSYKLGKHIGIGTSVTNVAGRGWTPSIGFQFEWRKPSWSLIFNPAISIDKSTNHVLVAEYFPKISKDHKWQLYTRCQVLYIQDFKNGTHSRSQYSGRLGVSYKKYTIGAAVNYDYYGISKREKRNFGPFLRVSL